MRSTRELTVADIKGAIWREAVIETIAVKRKKRRRALLKALVRGAKRLERRLGRLPETMRPLAETAITETRADVAAAKQIKG